MERFSLRTSRRAVLLTAVLASAASLASIASPMLAQSPSPAPSGSPSVQPNPDITIDAHALLGGHVRPGAWTAIDVLVSNNGPAVTGELLIRGPQQTQSRYGVDANLPNGARQQFTLYAQTAVFGSRVNVDLVSGDQTIATKPVPITSHDAFTPIAAVIAEHPEGILPAVTAAMVNPNTSAATVIPLGIADLPPRVEAWAAIDRLGLAGRRREQAHGGAAGCAAAVDRSRRSAHDSGRHNRWRRNSPTRVGAAPL